MLHTIRVHVKNSMDDMNEFTHETKLSPKQINSQGIYLLPFTVDQFSTLGYFANRFIYGIAPHTPLPPPLSH